MSHTLTIHKVHGPNGTVGINGGDAEGLVGVGVLVEVDRVVLGTGGIVIHNYRKAD